MMGKSEMLKDMVLVLSSGRFICMIIAKIKISQQFLVKSLRNQM
jgi:hypothetical protein